MIRLAILAVLVCAVLYLLYLLFRRVTSVSLDYSAKSHILAKPEQGLYEELKEAFPEHHIFSQVALGSLIQVSPELVDQKKRSILFDLIAGKIVCFIVLHSDYTLALAISIEDKKQTNTRRKKSDKELMNALQNAGIKLIKFDKERLPLAAELRALL